VALVTGAEIKMNVQDIAGAITFSVDASATTSSDSKLNGIWQVGYDAVTQRFIATNQTTGETRSAAAQAIASDATITIDFGNGMVLVSGSVGTINSVDKYTGFSGSFKVTGAVTKQDEVLKEFISINGEEIALEVGMNKAVFKNNNISINFASSYSMGSLTTADGATLTVDRNENKNLVIQTGANQGDELAISLDQMDAWNLGVKTANIGNRLDASAAITQVNNALNLVSTQRATLGALQNRLDFKIANLDISAENLQGAESRIRDVDMAKQMTSFTKNNILFQASTAMLAQANALPQGVLQLLG
jgi:flagellin